MSPELETPGDPKPWFCINCSDRFVHDQTSKGVHWCHYRPRETWGRK